MLIYWVHAGFRFRPLRPLWFSSGFLTLKHFALYSEQGHANKYRDARKAPDCDNAYVFRYFEIVKFWETVSINHADTIKEVQDMDILL